MAWQPGFDKTRQTDYDQVVGLIGATPQPIAGVAVALQIQGDPAPFGPAGFVVTCPPISRDN